MVKGVSYKTIKKNSKLCELFEDIKSAVNVDKAIARVANLKNNIKRSKPRQISLSIFK